MKMLENRRMNSNGGFSLLEGVATIAILGIITGIAIKVYGGVLGKSEERVALTHVERLNQGLSDYEQLNWRIKRDPIDDSIVDETEVLESLQYRSAANPAPGSPYIRPDWHPVESADTTTYRIEWKGRHFSLLEPGEAGTGFLIDFEGGDIGDNKVFPPEYMPLGLADDDDDDDGGGG